MRFEACVESADGVLAALEAGADRVELCADLAAGGTTPSIGLIQWAVAAAASRVAVHVLIRPRGGDFVYSADEAGVMLRDIAAANAAGAGGIVLGALTREGAVDSDLCARLISAARPASVTFHRAFDQAADPHAAFDDVLALGADRLLTSGAAPAALDGADLIAALVRRSGGRLAVMPGGGVTESTVAEIVRRTAATELHFSGRTSDAAGQPLAVRLAKIISTARNAARPANC